MLRTHTHTFPQKLAFKLVALPLLCVDYVSCNKNSYLNKKVTWPLDYGLYEERVACDAVKYCTLQQI